MSLGGWVSGFACCLFTEETYFFDAVGDEEVALLVLVPDIARLEEAVGGERVGGAFGVVQVPLEDVGALDPQLADLACGQLLLLGRHVLCGLVGEQGADGPDGLVPVLPGLGVRGGACLREAVALLDGDPQPLVDGVHQLSCQRCGARVHHADRAEVVLFDYWVLAEEQHDRRDDVGEGDLVLLDEAAEVFEVEFRHHDKLQPGV